MRGKIAAACAAVLVGLSPAGALPFARFAAAAVACASQEKGAIEPLRAERQPAPQARSGGLARHWNDGALRLAIFRSPSGPAPSQAPPAA
jgi:hypothetical protein